MPDGDALEDVVVDGLEITGQTDAEIYAGVGRAKRFVIRNNLMPHIRSQGIVIYMIGNDQEARGVLLFVRHNRRIFEGIDPAPAGSQERKREQKYEP